MSLRECFYHPYTPYHIQLQLMLLIYDTLQDPTYKIGLFESPTGTGKTLSLICSTMTWLREYKKNNFMKTVELCENDDDDDEPQWVKQQYIDNILSRRKNTLKEYETYLDELDIDSLPQLMSKDESEQHNPRKKRKTNVEIKIEAEEDRDLIPDDYHSDGEFDSAGDKNMLLSNEIKSLLFELEGVPANSVDTSSISNEIKIYFASRTHSQLSQLSQLLEIVNFPSSFGDEIKERLKYLPLGSRKQYCINDKVNTGTKSLNQINEECLDLLQSTSSKKNPDAHCKYYPKPQDTSSQQLVKLFTDITFSSIHDIEDLLSLGSRLSVCPYYSVRSGVDISEVISLPYQLLLEKTAREKLQLKLDQSVVIIDELHNLIDTIQLMNSSNVSLAQIKLINSALSQYFAKFKKKFNSGNRINLMIIIKILKQLQEFLESKTVQGFNNGQVFQVVDIYKDSTTDLLNFYKLENYLSKSKIAYKLESFMKRSYSQQAPNKQQQAQPPLLFKIINFLKSLSNPSKEGKFYLSRAENSSQVSMNYILLDPQEVFLELLERSRCIILAGGTMEPMEEYHKVLFPQLSDSQINKFSCDHIIPKQNLETFIVPQFNSIPFEINFKNRNNVKMFLALLDFILDSILKVPDGVIIFFPNYKITSIIVKVWKSSGKFDKLAKLKPIFYEGDHVLEEYTNSVKSGAGGILISVMNGKLSEGINFNDELCRCVILVGLPYPNEQSSEMILRKDHLYKQAMSRNGNNTQMSEKVVREMIDNMMIRIVNQSCGRCIRHANDYSCIILCDSRYGRIQSKLSKWIRDRINPAANVSSQVEQFFSHKRSNH